MRKPLHKILTGMTVLLLFPVVITVIYEYVRINDNEKLISTVYKNQLETIVSSVNTYAQDVAEDWNNQLQLWLRYSSDAAPPDKLIRENPSITSISFLQENQTVRPVFSSGNPANSRRIADSLARTNEREFNQLKTYYKNGYQKIISKSLSPEKKVICFVAEDGHQNLTIFFVGIDLPVFLQNQMGQRIRSIARDFFIIALTHEPTHQLLITSEKEPPPHLDFDQAGSMWLFPNIQIGISLKNQTIHDLASDRLNEGLLLMGVVLVVLLLGLWFLFYSVKREIQLAQIKSEFIANVSHEIRTPLALISMYVETLEMGRVRTTEKIKEYYDIIGKETRRLTGIVNKILDFSKLESGKRKLSFGTCDLNSITQEVLDTYEFHLRQKGFELNFSPASEMPDIRCDREAIGDALVNLIDNAVKYSHPTKIIEIKTGTVKRQSFVEVKDHGPGIPPKKQKLVFDKFYRITSGDLAHEVKGTGLGLALVNEIVKAHKGKVTLDSKPGKGCAFRLYFPVNPLKKES